MAEAARRTAALRRVHRQQEEAAVAASAAAARAAQQDAAERSLGEAALGLMGEDSGFFFSEGKERMPATAVSVDAGAAAAMAAPAAWASGLANTRAILTELGALSRHWQEGLGSARSAAAARKREVQQRQRSLEKRRAAWRAARDAQHPPQKPSSSTSTGTGTGATAAAVGAEARGSGSGDPSVKVFLRAERDALDVETAALNDDVAEVRAATAWVEQRALQLSKLDAKLQRVDRLAGSHGTHLHGGNKYNNKSPSRRGGASATGGPGTTARSHGWENGKSLDETLALTLAEIQEMTVELEGGVADGAVATAPGRASWPTSHMHAAAWSSQPPPPPQPPVYFYSNGIENMDPQQHSPQSVAAAAGCAFVPNGYYAAMPPQPPAAASHAVDRPPPGTAYYWQPAPPPPLSVHPSSLGAAPPPRSSGGHYAGRSVAPSPRRVGAQYHMYDRRAQMPPNYQACPPHVAPSNNHASTAGAVGASSGMQATAAGTSWLSQLRRNAAALPSSSPQPLGYPGQAPRPFSLSQGGGKVDGVAAASYDFYRRSAGRSAAPSEPPHDPGKSANAS